VPPPGDAYSIDKIGEIVGLMGSLLGADRGSRSRAETHTYDGKQLVTTVDAAPDPGRIGTKQPRGVRFDNGLMILIPPPRVVDGVTEHREITWEKVSDV
jgi:hypothetical protein